MARLPYQVLVFPFRRDQDEAIKYAVFERAYGGGWGAITGGGEEDESPLETAERQASEKAAIPLESEFLALASFATVPVEAVAGFLPWGPEILVMPEYAFAVEVGQTREFVLSGEHWGYQWLDYDPAQRRLVYDPHKNALWELNYRLKRKGQAT